jgi:hypothetical protein
MNPDLTVDLVDPPVPFPDLKYTCRACTSGRGTCEGTTKSPMFGAVRTCETQKAKEAA